MSTIAIVGAGPGLGLALARTFGRQGFSVALLSRSRANLDGYVAELAAEGVTAAGFAADVTDTEGLSRGLADAAEHFGGIDVLEYSPVGTAEDSGLTSPSGTRILDVQRQMEFQLYGSITATHAVLPAMREAGAGTLFFTTGAGSITPVPFIANVNSAAAALRNWAINLNTELAGTGVYAAHVAIDVSINGAVPDFPSATADEVAAAYWSLYVARDSAEHVVTA
ncbi:SDR family NAD(P)-dependent oxidoreductase [Agromyces atrinae]|uniref:SDR family NAD(P)-dependent oxidoreductase n=1 Tax=Agromyces atrinae TaxID=592376 RepID=UPI001F593E6B|nr:SDR family NAD(P)-dependent oxidoreductase [Agromyces atrinae]MCI2956684.1 SDR family NAD(P)-dependent oxidoreductase [Agromyces atrinae]